MIGVEQKQQSFLAAFEQFEKRTEVKSSWLAPKRKAAIARFAELGFPSTRHEEWRYTNLRALSQTAFQRAGQSTDVEAKRLAPFEFEGAGVRLVFVNGQFRSELSSVGRLASGVKVLSLARAIRDHSNVVEPHLARYVVTQDDVFAALNSAFIEDGAFIHLPKNLVVDEPIHLMFVQAADEAPMMIHPRILLVAEPGSQASVVETYAGLGEGVYFTNPVTELVAGENAVLDHYKVVRESPATFHIGLMRIQQGRSSNVTTHVLNFEGGLVRNDFHAVMDGEGGECTINGLTMIEGTQHVDNHLRVEHAKPHCRSWEYFKSVLDGSSRSVFTGRIVVHKDAQKTDAKQTNMNLILSDEALADSKPQLEIFADDVKCTHGATIGQVDADAIFYLRSRGLSAEAARSLLVYAFAGESIGQIKVEGLRRNLDSLILSRLPRGDGLSGLFES